MAKKSLPPEMRVFISLIAIYANTKAGAVVCCVENGRLYGTNHVGNKSAQRAPERIILFGDL